MHGEKYGLLRLIIQEKSRVEKVCGEDVYPGYAIWGNGLVVPPVNYLENRFPK